MNTATHCHKCGKLLDKNRYNVSPEWGGVCRNKAWCPDCYEIIHKTSRRNVLEPASARHDEEDDNENS